MKQNQELSCSVISLRKYNGTKPDMSHPDACHSTQPKLPLQGISNELNESFLLANSINKHWYPLYPRLNKAEGWWGRCGCIWIQPLPHFNNITRRPKLFNAFMSMEVIFGADLTTHVLIQRSETLRMRKHCLVGDN